MANIVAHGGATRWRGTILAAGIASCCGALVFGYARWVNLPVSRVDVYDGFEARGLSGIWDTDKFVRGAIGMQSEFVRAGRGAAKVVLHSRDKFEAGVNGDRDTERAELMEASKLFSSDDRTYESSFSVMIPSDFPVVPVRLVIAQWKQKCPGEAGCSDNSPVLAVRYVAGVLRITRQTEPRRETLFETSESLLGKWTDFRFRTRFTPREDGLIQVWLNGRQVVDYRGATAYAESAATGYTSPSPFYFKMGLYRDVMEAPMTMYIDEYRKKQLPGGAQGR